jgi:hypothetical protein
VYLEIDAKAFAVNFAVRSYAVRHALADHPLLTVEAIAELADRLPESAIEHNIGKLAIVQGAAEAPRVNQSPGEVARGIETNGCWMVLKNIETDLDYRHLLDDCLDEVASFVAGREGGMARREGFIFLSAPGSVTPAHFDPEHNFLLQNRGRKSMNVGSFPDPRTEQLEVERYHAGGIRNIECKPADPCEYLMGPGDGVYVPVHQPHWVAVPDNVSVSLSITFFTNASEDARVLHRVNGRLRKLGLDPSPIGRRPAADRVKVISGRAIQTLVEHTIKRG